MPPLPAVLTVLLAAAATPAPASPAPPPGAAAAVQVRAAPGLPGSAFGPLRQSLEAARQSLSALETGCAEGEPQDALHARRLACTAAGQVSGNPPKGPSWTQWLVFTVLAVIVALAVALGSKL